jgi:c-di-GMP-binding flagellar brake protein YcgR
MNWDSTERRRFVRIKLPCEIVVCTPQKQTIPATVENISASGVKITIEKKLEISSIVSLDIYAVKEKPIACKGKVVWRKTKGNSCLKDNPLFDTGIKFYQIKDEDVRIIKDLIVSIVTDRR